MKDTSKKVAAVVITLGLLGIAGISAIIMSKKRNIERKVVTARRPITRSMTIDPDEEIVLTRKSKYFESPTPEEDEGEYIEEEEEKKTVEIIPNSGGGDCLFHCFKTAIASSSGLKPSIKALRKVVADAATQDQFETLKIIYDNALEEKEYQVVNDYLFMNGVKDLQGLKKAIMKRSYWGDEMALQALEKKTNLKVLVFTTISGKMDLASQLDTKEVPESGKYIMVLLHNLHYQLIKYGDKVMFTHDELPPQIQQEV